MVSLLRGAEAALRHAAGRARHGRRVRAGRPHHRAGLRPRDRHRHAGRDPRHPEVRQAYLGEEAALMLRVDEPRSLLRRQPGAVRHRFRGRRRRGRDADGPQRHGQDDDGARGDGPAARLRAARSSSTASAIDRPAVVSASPGSASAWCPRAGRSSPTSRCARTWSPPRPTAPAAPTLDARRACSSSSRGSPSGRAIAATSSSGGEQQMLAIGRALMTNPRLLILDEATEGLAPLIRQEIWACLARLKARGPGDPGDRQERRQPDRASPTATTSSRRAASCGPGTSAALAGDEDAAAPLSRGVDFPLSVGSSLEARFARRADFSLWSADKFPTRRRAIPSEISLRTVKGPESAARSKLIMGNGRRFEARKQRLFPRPLPVIGVRRGIMQCRAHDEAHRTAPLPWCS